MKCVKFGSEVKRVKDEEAKTLVAKGSWVYCGKEVWKKGRTATSEVKVESTEKKTPKKYKTVKTDAEKIADKIAAPVREVTAADIMNQATFSQPTMESMDDKKSKKIKKNQKK